MDNKIRKFGYSLGTLLAFVFIVCLIVIMVGLTIKFMMWLF